VNLLNDALFEILQTLANNKLGLAHAAFQSVCVMGKLS